MKVLIKEWPNRTATIMTENGQVVWAHGRYLRVRDVPQERRVVTGARQALEGLSVGSEAPSAQPAAPADSE